MARDPFWAAEALKLTAEKVERSRLAMEKRLRPAVRRRQNTRELVEQIITDPSQIPPQGLEALAQYNRERYGDAARFVNPFIAEQVEEAMAQAEEGQEELL